MKKTYISPVTEETVINTDYVLTVLVVSGSGTSSLTDKTADSKLRWNEEEELDEEEW